MRQVTYGEIIDALLDKIYSVCDNLETIQGIDGTLKRGYSWVVQQGNKQSVKGLVTDGRVTPVSKNTIIQQLTDFLKSRGVYSKRDTVITSRGLLCLFNNVASFLSIKIVQIVNPVTGKHATVYDSTYNDFPVVSLQDSQVPMTQGDATTYISQLLSSINSANGKDKLSISISYACSCCSSSSCSSSSCSSSCWYIAFIKM